MTRFYHKCTVATVCAQDCGGCFELSNTVVSQPWALSVDPQKEIPAFENKCLRKLLHIFYLKHKTKDWVLR